MKHFPFLLFFALIPLLNFAQYDGNVSPSYPDLIETYKSLDKAHAEIELYAMGPCDYGLPIYLCIINGKGDSLQSFQAAREGTTLLINNAIHPGEPDGINACLIWINAWIKNGKPLKDLPTIGIIPAYNVGGMMNRSSTSRANQDGPEEYGFRGNAQNLDLNRDFIKSDSKNMFTFARIYHALDPDVFLDTHVSNGADYQYTMTYIASVRERMAPPLASLMHDEMIPVLEKKSAQRGFDLCPYVNTKGETPETGLEVFNDLPRYAMGYASLLGAISFTLETHMLKPFPQRVKATVVFLEETIEWMKTERKKIESARLAARQWELEQDYFRYNFRLQDDFEPYLFKGYAHSNPISEITGLPRLKYHQDQPIDQEISYYNHYEPSDSLPIPKFIVVGGQCQEVLERLASNHIEMEVIQEERTMPLSQCRVKSTENGDRPYEGHYLHQNTKVEWIDRTVTLKPGDCMIPMDQVNKRFIMSALQPDAPDSYFAWNYFDSYLQQKEYFSPYIFEDMAVEILKKDEALRQELTQKQEEDEDFRNSSWDQLYFIYTRSPYYEPSHNFLPIFYAW